MKSITFDELSRRYCEHAQSRLRPRTYTNRLSLLRALGAQLGRLPLDDITAEAIDRFTLARVGARLRPVSVNNELRVLRRVLAFAHGRGLVGSRVRVELVAGEDERRAKVWTVDEVARLLDAARRVSPAMMPLLTCIANTGCRRGEALALPWERVNVARGLVEFWPSEEWRPKNGKPREVPISDPLRALLGTLPRSARWVFPSSRGARWAYWPQRAFDRARDAARLTGGVHTLRHTFASHFLARCPDLPLLARLLGHSDERVTRLYAHLLPDHLEKARNVVTFTATRPARNVSVVGTLKRAAHAAWQRLRAASRAERRKRKILTPRGV